MRTIFVIILLAAASGCQSTAEKFCERADSCNILVTSVMECVETIDKALDDLTESQREEAELELEQCIDRPSCSGFESCVFAGQTREGDAAWLRPSGQLAGE